MKKESSERDWLKSLATGIIIITIIFSLFLISLYYTRPLPLAEGEPELDYSIAEIAVRFVDYESFKPLVCCHVILLILTIIAIWFFKKAYLERKTLNNKDKTDPLTQKKCPKCGWQAKLDKKESYFCEYCKKKIK